MPFQILSDDEFEQKFLSMVAHGKKSSTYKFAFARFLLEYCNKDSVEKHVEFSIMAKHFLDFFWPQICKTKLAHSPRYTKQGGIKKLEIVDIIENQFTESWYPKNYSYYVQHEESKIQNCIDGIAEKCFNDVAWRFQKINDEENTLFFEYKIKSGWTNPNRKKTDLTFGINLNPSFFKFVKKRYVLLHSLVILEWTRFLEQFNRDVPLIIPKLEGSEIKRNATYSNKAKKELRKYRTNCFYCNTELTEDQTHLEHVIPFDYIAEDNIWNYSLACQPCNCHKLGSLPPIEFIDKLIGNITTDRARIEMLDESLKIIGDDFADIIRNHYKSAERLGYSPKEMPPNNSSNP